MTQQLRFKPKKQRKNPLAQTRFGAAFEPAVAGAAGPAPDFPGIIVREPESSRRTLVTGAFAAFLHGGAVLVLVLLASLAPEVAEQIIEVQILKDQPEQADNPAPARRVLRERRSPNFAPQVQSYAPQVVNPRVIADAAPAVSARALDMDSVSSVVAPRQITRSSAPVVERVSAVNSPIAARASKVDVQGVGGPAVRGPIQIDAPIGPSVGPRQVAVASAGRSSGTGQVQIGGSGSSVREGKITGRDVLGSPTGAPLVSIDTQVGDGLLRGSGGTGDSVTAASATQCFQRPEVQRYISSVQERTLDRWILPPGVRADQKVTLRFKLDVAGSAQSVSLVRASDNALGASAVDALNAASPFPPLPTAARCLVQVPITATFTNPVAG
ncbi:MAG: energy transducer TonB [Myxococcota bacterium]|nr:energy transducer TonB [Myxococcota bacterium]